MKISKYKGKIPTCNGRSMTGGGEGPSIAKAAASLPARLLGAMKELWSSENRKEEEERDSLSENSLKI